MKLKTIALTTLTFTTIGAYADNALNVSLSDPKWDGKTIPKDQQCEKFGGQGSTPLLAINNIPAGTNALVMEYSDRSYQAMDLGGHGKIAYRIEANTSTIEVPTIKGHTFELPEDFFLIEAHRAPTWDKAGAYLPPCSGGSGNEYYLTIKAVKEVNSGIRETFGEAELPLGKY